SNYPSAFRFVRCVQLLGGPHGLISPCLQVVAQLLKKRFHPLRFDGLKSERIEPKLFEIFLEVGVGLLQILQGAQVCIGTARKPFRLEATLLLAVPIREWLVGHGGFLSIAGGAATPTVRGCRRLCPNSRALRLSTPYSVDGCRWCATPQSCAATV